MALNTPVGSVRIRICYRTLTHSLAQSRVSVTLILLIYQLALIYKPRILPILTYLESLSQ